LFESHAQAGENANNMKLKIGDKAPDFKLKNQNGKTVSLLNYKGRWVLLYFYPKDFTGGCTKEACTLRDNFSDFKNLKVKVVGVSVDSTESHKKFKKEYNLPFDLLSDEEKEAVKLYNAWGKKNFMGREYYGTLRISFLIDPKGIIKNVYKSVKPAFHSKEVLRDLAKILK